MEFTPSATIHFVWVLLWGDKPPVVATDAPFASASPESRGTVLLICFLLCDYLTAIHNVYAARLHSAYGLAEKIVYTILNYEF